MKPALIVAAILAITLTACGKKEEAAPPPPPPPPAPAAEPAPAPDARFGSRRGPRSGRREKAVVARSKSDRESRPQGRLFLASRWSLARPNPSGRSSREARLPRLTRRASPALRRSAASPVRAPAPPRRSSPALQPSAPASAARARSGRLLFWLRWAATMCCSRAQSRRRPAAAACALSRCPKRPAMRCLSVCGIVAARQQLRVVVASPAPAHRRRRAARRYVASRIRHRSTRPGAAHRR